MSVCPACQDLRSTFKTLRKEKRTLGLQVRSLTRRLATTEKKIAKGQQGKKPKGKLQRDAQPGYEHKKPKGKHHAIPKPKEKEHAIPLAARSTSYEYNVKKKILKKMMVIPDKILPNSYLMMSPQGKVASIATPIKIDGKVVWVRWEGSDGDPCTASAS